MIVLWMAAHPWVILVVLMLGCVSSGVAGWVANGARSYRAGWVDADAENERALIELAAAHARRAAQLEDDEPLSPLPLSHPVWRNSKLGGRLSPSDQPLDSPPALKSSGPAMVPGEIPGRLIGGHETAGPEAPWLPAEPWGPMQGEWERLGLPLDAPPTLVQPTAVLSPLPHPDSPAAERLAGPDTLARGFMSVHNRAYELAVPEGWRR